MQKGLVVTEENATPATPEPAAPATPEPAAAATPKIKVTYVSLSHEGNIIERDIDVGKSLSAFVEEREHDAQYEDLTVKVNGVLMEYDEGNYTLKDGDKITVTSKRYGGAV